MADTFLFDSIIFGPVKSRRLGISLGINLLPLKGKLCTFDCIYCECGLKNGSLEGNLPKRKDVFDALEYKLSNMAIRKYLPNSITFAGNGEPTLHPDFGLIIDDTIELRNKYAPESKITVLSNATRIHNESVFNSLLKIDNNILKIDSGIEQTIKNLNVPIKEYSLEKHIQYFKKFRSRFTVQTMFLKGIVGDKYIDNTTDEEISQYLKILEEIKPQNVMIYSIDRNTPFDTLTKITYDELNIIADRIRKIIPDVLVSG